MQAVEVSVVISDDVNMPKVMMMLKARFRYGWDTFREKQVGGWSRG
jgi:hypothetical protein